MTQTWSLVGYKGRCDKWVGINCLFTGLRASYGLASIKMFTGLRASLFLLVTRGGNI